MLTNKMFLHTSLTPPQKKFPRTYLLLVSDMWNIERDSPSGLKKKDSFFAQWRNGTHPPLPKGSFSNDVG